MPPLLRGIFEHAVGAHPDCELLRETKGAYHMLREGTVSPDIVILGLSTAEDATLVSALFARWPQARVMTVTPTGDDSVVYELTPHRRVLGQMSPGEIVETLRQAVHRNRRVSRD
jgi:DNA-binding NarL/FixJ family response regulator